nr:hypothetical protein CFP56_36384 [Quercus suber]
MGSVTFDTAFSEWSTASRPTAWAPLSTRSDTEGSSLAGASACQLSCRQAQCMWVVRRLKSVSLDEVAQKRAISDASELVGHGWSFVVVMGEGSIGLPDNSIDSKTVDHTIFLPALCIRLSIWTTRIVLREVSRSRCYSQKKASQNALQRQTPDGSSPLCCFRSMLLVVRTAPTISVTCALPTHAEKAAQILLHVSVGRGPYTARLLTDRSIMSFLAVLMVRDATVAERGDHNGGQGSLGEVTLLPSYAPFAMKAAQ